MAIGIAALPHIFLKYFTQERIQVIKDHPLHPDFQNQSIKPIFWSHGLVFNRTGYSGICRELASHGYIVYAFDHSDGSSSYTNAEGMDKYCTDYNPKIHKGTAEEYR